jgi:Adenylate and Guanylate cyclase catalytic domain
MTSIELACAACGIELPANSKFCNGCGAPVAAHDTHAEFKQVTVLFADVVHSMDIAAAVGAERLREIMAELSDRCAVVVRRYGSTVTQWTGDGIMAVFGAPGSWWKHCCSAAPAPTSRRRRPRSTGWQPSRPTPDSSCSKFRCCGCGLCWRGLTAMRRLTLSSGIATATWRKRLAEGHIAWAEAMP